MAKQSINQLKQWFETGDYPTQQQFWDWLESYFHKDDKIPVDSVDTLTQILQGKADSSTVNELIDHVLPITVIANPSSVYGVTIQAGFAIDFIAIKGNAVRTVSVLLDGVEITTIDVEVGKYSRANIDWFCTLNTALTLFR